MPIHPTVGIRHPDEDKRTTSPIARIFSITPSDGVDLVNFISGIWVGTAGNVTVVTPAGDEVLLMTVQAGMWHRIWVSRVKVTGTTALGIVGGY